MTLYLSKHHRHFEKGFATYLFNSEKNKIWCQIGLTKVFCFWYIHLHLKKLLRLWHLHINGLHFHVVIYFSGEFIWIILFYTYNCTTSLEVLFLRKLLWPAFKLEFTFFISKSFIRSTSLKIFQNIMEKLSNIRDRTSERK